MPSTYAGYSKQILGYEAPVTKINARYIAARKIQEWLDDGKTPQQILLYWNAGEGAKKCSKGVNKYKVKFDSCSYVQKGMALLINTAYAEE